MKKIIEIKDWKLFSKTKETNIYININTYEKIKEIKDENHFKYFNFKNEYLGRYNSDISLFKDSLILIVLDSKY